MGNGVGDFLGNAFMAPFKAIFAHSCEGICSGPWDMLCFIQHLCVSNLFRLFIILILCYIILLFFYLLFKLGFCQCIGKSLCKMCWSVCEVYWMALEDIVCFLCHKLLSTKRVNRRRRYRRHHFRDVEQGYDYGRSSSDEADFHSRQRDKSQRSLRYSKRRQASSGRSRGPRSAARLQLSKVRSAGQDRPKAFKRRRLN